MSASAGRRVAALVVIAVTLLAKLKESTNPDPIAFADGAIFAEIGKGVVHGQLPYKDFWDHKPPGIYYVDAVILKVFPSTPWTFHLIEIPISLVAALLFFRLTRLYSSQSAAAVCVVLFAFFLTLPALDQGGNLTELYVDLFSLAAMWLGLSVVLEKMPPAVMPIAGAATGIAALFKPQAYVVIPVLMYSLLAFASDRHRSSNQTVLVSLAYLVVGALIPPALALLLIMHAGILPDFVSQVITYNRLYASAAGPLTTLRHLLQARYGLLMLAESLAVFSALTITARQARRQDPRRFRVTVMLMIWTVGGVLSVFSDHHFFDHDFLMTVPPTMGGLSLLLTHASSRERSILIARAPALLGRLTAAGALFLMLVVAFGYVANLSFVRIFPWGTGPKADTASQQVVLARFAGLQVGVAFAGPEADTERVKAIIDARTTQQDRILSWCPNSGEVFLAGRMPASKYLYSNPLLNVYGFDTGSPYATPSMLRNFLVSLRSSRPSLLTLWHTGSAWSLPGLKSFVRDDYHRVAHVHACDIYARERAPSS